MDSILVHMDDGSVTLTAQAVRRLLDRGDGDASLLYLALLRHQGTTPPRALAGELRWDRGRIESAEAVLRDLGLLAPPERAALEPADEHPAYQAADIARRLEGSGEFRQLISEVERRLGKKLSTPDVGILLELYDYLGLPADVIYLLVCHCAQRIQDRYGPGRRPGMKQIQKEGYAWARAGIDSQAEAASYLSRYAQRQEALPRYMQALRLGERPPVSSEEKYLAAWQEMGFPPETVALAYDRTVFHCHELKWPYLNGILKRWHQAGLHSPAEVAAHDRPAPPAARPGRAKAGDDVSWMKKYIQQRDKGG